MSFSPIVDGGIALLRQTRELLSRRGLRRVVFTIEKHWEGEEGSLVVLVSGHRHVKEPIPTCSLGRVALPHTCISSL